MRLLERSGASEFTLTEDFVDDNEVPPYAILSHTWVEGEEVTFEDLTNNTDKDKLGYEKLRFCGEQARRDGLRYFWVDTCCINRANFTELSRAVNSMFHWYRNAARCYVYLSDVSTAEREASELSASFPCEAAFRASRWFKRGWTLQELLAPGSVEFFSQDCERIGNKRTLDRQIHEITKIALPALQGTPLSQFSIEERFSWAEDRQTTHKEDKAYSLLGVFDVYMPLIYGEGEDNAFARLREAIDKPQKAFDRLPYATDAPFNSYAKRHEPSCLPDTRVDLLQTIYDWADGQDGPGIFWLSGLAGTGKSTIARTIARRYFDKNRLGASFFFSRGGGDVAHAGKFCSTIAVQLASSVRTSRRYISDAVSENDGIANRSLYDQWQLLVLGALSKVDGNSHRLPYVLVVDALDECDDGNDVRTILKLLAGTRSLKNLRVRVFVTSRPEEPIRRGFYHMLNTEYRHFALHNMSPSVVDRDISMFLGYNLKLIGEEQSQEADWPGPEIIKDLVRSAGGIFIWAATACRFVREGLFADERLRTLLQGSASAAATPEEHLNGIYITVLHNSVQPTLSQEDKHRFYSILRDVLGCIVSLSSPLSVHSLSKLIASPIQRVSRILQDLHAVLDIPDDPIQPLRLHHPSFREFLLDKTRCSDSNFWVDEKQTHETLVKSCIQLMSTYLKQDICGLDAPGVLVTEVEHSRVKQCLPPEVQYACLYWVGHLQKSGTQLHDNGQVHQFLQSHFLHWLEALSWMRRISEGIQAIRLIESIAPSDQPHLVAFIHDMKRFALYGRSAIDQAPLQTYCGALMFVPMKSLVREQFENCIPEWIQGLHGVREGWSAALQTFEGHTQWVSSVRFSPDGTLLASGSIDSTIRLWDIATGAVVKSLNAHLSVYSVAFSPDGWLLASGCSDGTVKLWDTATGEVVKSLNAHSSVYSVAFSSDGSLLASCYQDRTVRIWDTATGAVVKSLKGHTKHVDSVAFSPDGRLLASGCRDGTVRLWDTATGAVARSLESDSGAHSVAFSPDGGLLASSSGATVNLWDAASGAFVKSFQSHTERVISVEFSPDSMILASGSVDMTVKLWDIATGAVVKSLDGHTDCITSVALSPDGMLVASGSFDKTVTLWDAVVKSPEACTDHVDSDVVLSDNTMLASGADDNTARLWERATSTTVKMFECHTEEVSSIAFSPDRALLASGSTDTTVKLWDTATGVVVKTLEGHTLSVRCVAFSPDGVLLASVSDDTTVRLWDTATGKLLKTLEGHAMWIRSITFSPNGVLLASRSEDMTVRIWETTTGAAVQTLECYAEDVSSVWFSPNGMRLATGSDSNGTAWLWDTATRAAVPTLVGVRSVAFSPDGALLALGLDDRTVRLWDTVTGTTVDTLQGHTDVVRSVAFSPDGALVASCSSRFGATVRLWDTMTGAAIHTIVLDSDLQILSFSADGLFLETTHGLLSLEVPEDRFPQYTLSPQLLLDGTWVVRNSRKLLWLPPDLRGGRPAVKDNVLALGHTDGRVTIMRFG